MRPSPVPIVGGTGALGFGLAVRLARAGVPVVIGSRRPESAEEAAEKARERLPDSVIEGAENADAVTRGEIVFLTVPFRAQSENLTNLRNALREGQILVDATVPLAAAVSGKATRLLGVPQGSAAQQAQEMVPDGVTVVKRRVAELIDRVDGLRSVNAGALETARLVEGLTPLLISVNSRNKVTAGIRLTRLDEPRW